MAIWGDASAWGDFFPDDLIADVLDLLLRCWDKFPKPLSADHENSITGRYREVLCRDKNCRKLPFSIWPESSETDPNTGAELGRIDLRFLHGHREDVYLAFECKRLRIPREKGLTPNTAEYVGENGIMRHITGKYSQGLDKAGMIAYVMDGDSPKARNAVARLIGRKREELRLEPGSGLSSSAHCPDDARVAQTIHDLNETPLTMHHVFLDVPCASRVRQGDPR